MIRVLPAFYQLLVSPLRFVQLYASQTPLRLGFFIVFLASLAAVPEWFADDLSLFSSFSLVFFGYCILLALQAMMTDFFAQLNHLRGRSLALFAWFCVSLLPFILAPVFLLLARHFAFPSFFKSCHALLGFLVLIWELYIIKEVYQCSLRKSILLYVLPLFILISLFFILALLGASLFSLYG